MLGVAFLIERLLTSFLMFELMLVVHALPDMDPIILGSNMKDSDQELIGLKSGLKDLKILTLYTL